MVGNASPVPLQKPVHHAGVAILASPGAAEVMFMEVSCLEVIFFLVGERWGVSLVTCLLLVQVPVQIGVII